MSSDAREQAIRESAYSKWEQAGCPAGDGVEYWLAAEQEIDVPGMSESMPAATLDENSNSNSIKSTHQPPPPMMSKMKSHSRQRS